MSQVKVRIVCTDKETHPSRELEVVNYDPTTGIAAPVRGRRGRYRISGLVFNHDQDADDSLVDLGDVADPRGALWRFRCPSCPLDVQWRDDTLHKRLAPIVAAGRVSVDLSVLPANLR